MSNDPAEMTAEEAAHYDEQERKEAEQEREELEQSAHSIIACTDVLEMFCESLSAKIAGERPNAQLLFLVGTSRLFKKPMHAAIKGPSSGGKSELRAAVLDYMPRESVIEFDTMSDKALFYWQDKIAHKILSLGEASGTDERQAQEHILRVLMSEGKAEHIVSERETDGRGYKAQSYKIDGPICFMVTTTRNELHPENETRVLSLEINDSEAQTRAVLEILARNEGLGEMPEVNHKPWQDFQRWLAIGETEVVIPFAADLAPMMRAAAVRLRRDFPQLLRAIKAHALIHKQHRETDAGRIVAELRDYEKVRGLMNSIVSANVGLSVRDEMRETVEAVKLLTAGEPDGTVTAYQVGRHLNLDTSTAHRRLKAAAHEGYCENMEQRRYQKGRYRCTDQNLPEPVGLLPTVAELREAMQTAQSCKRDGFDKELQEDGVCTGHANGLQTPVGDANAQTATQTAKSLKEADKEASFARLHENSGEDPFSGLKDPSRKLQDDDLAILPRRPA